jgi:hypothetical protein
LFFFTTQAGGQQSLAEKLGYAPDARLLDKNGYFYPST